MTRVYRPTYRRHRKQVFWQILFPMLLVTLGVLAVGVLAIVGDRAQASLWADTALVMLLPLALLVALLPLALTVAAVVGLFALLQAAPRWLALLQEYAAYAPAYARKWGNALVTPVLKLAGWQAAWRSVWQKMTGKR